MNENLVLMLNGEAGWQLTCDKRLVNDTGVAINLSPGHITPQVSQQRCEVLRLSGPLEGQLSVISTSNDGRIQLGEVVNISFQAPPQDSAMSTTAMVSVGAGGLLLVFGLLFFTRRRPNHDDEEELVESVLTGPPISEPVEQKQLPDLQTTTATAAGPPTSTASTDLQSPTPAAGPPLPEGGLPAGWTHEQWQYYGQQYLDGTL